MRKMPSEGTKIVDARSGDVTCGSTSMALWVASTPPISMSSIISISDGSDGIGAAFTRVLLFGRGWLVRLTPDLGPVLHEQQLNWHSRFM